MHPHRPFSDKPFRHRIGGRQLDLAEWIEVDSRFDAHLAEKDRLLKERHEDVFSVTDGSEAASEEVLSLLTEHMQTYFPNLLREVPAGLHPLDHAGRLVQEDLCIMIERDGAHYLAAASLCFPSMWRLSEKIGRSMEDIHRPVPSYQEDVGDVTESMFSRLRVDRPIWRLNWSMSEDPTLFQQQGHSSVSMIDHPSQLFLRIERQTLRRLPLTGAILFSIRVHVDPITDLVSQHDREALARSLELLPDPMMAYKSMSRVASQTLEWLRTAP